MIFFTGFYLNGEFAGIMDMVGEAILVCFICDEEMFTGQQRFSDRALREFMDEHGEEAVKNAEEFDIKAKQKIVNPKAIFADDDMDDGGNEDYNKDNIKGIDLDGFGPPPGWDPWKMLHDPALLDWDNMS